MATCNCSHMAKPILTKKELTGVYVCVCTSLS